MKHDTDNSRATNHAGATPRAPWWSRSCDWLELLGLMLWLGWFTALIAVVVPAVFTTLEMETGGRLLRRVFDGYHALTGGVVIVLLGTTLFRYRQSRREPERTPKPTRAEIGLTAALALVTCVIVAALGPQAVKLQDAAFAAESRDATRAAFDAFFRLHGLVRGLHLLNAAMAVSLLAVKCAHWGRRP